MTYFVCPKCKGPLDCKNCDFKIHSINEISCFIDEADHFYEGRFTASIPSSNSIKDLVRHLILRRLRFLNNQLTLIHARRGKLNILDLACGGGHGLLSKFGDVIGVDVSLKSLQEAKKLYKDVIRADAAQLPFKNGSFDVVVAMDFLGHIEVNNKNRIIAEIHRVLKPGGSTLQYIETLGDNSMQKMARKNPDFYKKHFIEREGHIGLESPRTVLERFHSLGLIPVFHESAYKSWLKPPGEISGRFEGDYANAISWLKIPVLIDSAFLKFTPLRLVGGAISELITEQIDKLLPFEMADGLFIVAIKGSL